MEARTYDWVWIRKGPAESASRPAQHKFDWLNGRNSGTSNAIQAGDDDGAAGHGSRFAFDRAGLVAAGSIAVALAVMSLKYVAYLKTGSVALYSDALESIVNLVTAIAALAAIQVSSLPADKNHPFGHTRPSIFRRCSRAL